MNKKLFCYPYLVWMLLFVLAPLVFIGYYAFTAKDGGLTLQNFVTVFTDKTYIPSLLDSLYLAALCTIICLGLGYPLAYILADKKMKMPSVIVLFFIMPMWMNFMLRTYAMKTILTSVPALDSFFMNSRAGVLLGMVYNFLPFMVLPIYSALSKMDTALYEAAADLGASPARVFRRVTLPLSMPGMISGMTMVFMPAVSTFAISTILGGGMVTVIGDIIDRKFTQSSGSAWNVGSAIALILMVLIVLSTILMNALDHSSVNEKKRKQVRV